MKIFKNTIYLLCIAVIAIGISACGSNKNEEMSVPVVYEFGDREITYAEFYIYARTVEDDYRQTYGNGVWGLELDADGDTDTVRDITIRDIISDINRVKVLSSRAEEMGISLSEEELSDSESKATDFYSGLTDKDLQETGIELWLIKEIIRENILAKKVYEQVLSNYDFEISDEEARMITFYDMLFECYDIEKDGSVKEYTDEKKAVQLEKANEALLSLAQDEDMTYDKIVNKYNLQYSGSYTMSRTQLIEEYGESVANMILGLSDGEVSVVIETQYGYHLFKMIDANDKDLTKENKAQIISAKQKEYFNGVYEEWIKEYDSGFNVNKDVDMELISGFPFEQTSSEE